MPPAHPEQWTSILHQVREARALLLRDAEGFDRAAGVLEHVGQQYGQRIQIGLGKYKPALLDLIHRGARQHHDEANRLFEVVREARNTAIHDGAWVRHLGLRLAELFLFIETAILSHMTLVKDMMVAGPTTAQPWQQLADVRRTLLLNSFSYLPVLMAAPTAGWHLIADHELVRFLANASGDTRRDLLSKSIAEAVGAGLTLIKAEPITEDRTIASIRTESLTTPLLVVRSPDHGGQLVGIITAFDLL
jgi:hypothetical protein